MEKLLQLAGGGVSEFKINNDYLSIPAGIKDMAYDTQNNTIVAITDDNVYRSTDNGIKWTKVLSTNGSTGKVFKKIIYVDDTNYQNVPGSEDKSGYFIIGNNGDVYYSFNGESLNGTGWMWVTLAGGSNITAINFNKKASKILFGTVVGDIFVLSTMNDYWMGSTSLYGVAGEEIVEILSSGSLDTTMQSAIAITINGNIYGCLDTYTSSSFGTNWSFNMQTESGKNGQSNFLSVFSKEKNAYIIPDYDTSNVLGGGTGTCFLRIDHGMDLNTSLEESKVYDYTYDITMMFTQRDVTQLISGQNINGVDRGFIYIDKRTYQNMVYFSNGSFNYNIWKNLTYSGIPYEIINSRCITSFLSNPTNSFSFYVGTNVGEIYKLNIQQPFNFFNPVGDITSVNNIGERFYKYPQQLIVVPGTEPLLFVPLAHRIYKRFSKSEGWKTIGKMDPLYYDVPSKMIWMNGYFLNPTGCGFMYSSDLLNWTFFSPFGYTSPTDSDRTCLKLKIVNGILFMIFGNGTNHTAVYAGSISSSGSVSYNTIKIFSGTGFNTPGNIMDVAFNFSTGKYIIVTKNGKYTYNNSSSSIGWSILFSLSSYTPSQDHINFVEDVGNGFNIVTISNKVWFTQGTSVANTYIRTLGYNILKLIKKSGLIGIGYNPNLYVSSDGNSWSTRLTTINGGSNGFTNHTFFNGEDALICSDGSITSGLL